MPQTKHSREREVVRILKAIRAIPASEPERRTGLVRDLADATISYREHFLTPEGNPDWTGRTGAYRWAMRDLYSEAGYPSDEATALQKTVRYHVAARLRERLSPEQLEDAGITAAPPLERMAARRERQAAMLGALSVADDEDGSEPSEAAKLRALNEALAILTKLRVNRRHLWHPAHSETAEAGRRVLQAIIARAEELVEAYPVRSP
jgi:hypothetical protein